MYNNAALDVQQELSCSACNDIPFMAHACVHMNVQVNMHQQAAALLAAIQNNAELATYVQGRR